MRAPAPLRQHAVRLGARGDRHRGPADRRTDPARAAGGSRNPGLPLLYFHYGRYLLCASSANAALPANLQGKWNEDLQPPWDSDYHHDVNLQMNYWLAEPAGMQRYVEALPAAHRAAGAACPARPPWTCMAAEASGTRSRPTPGAVRRRNPTAGRCGIGAAPWLAQHLWWHYEYGRDADFLRDRRLSVLQGGGRVLRGLPDRR